MSTDTASTPQTAARSSVAKPAFVHEKFRFDCDHLLSFCTNFEKCDITDQTDSILEIKLEDLEKRWQNLQTAYENLVLSPDTSNTKEFKENAKVNFDVCSEAYYETRSQMLDVLRIAGGNATRTSFVRQSIVPQNTFQTHQLPQSSAHDNSNICIKVPPCDTEVFKGGYEEWPSFRDMFTAVYVNHPKLSRAQKLYHLRNKTQGSAGAIVKRYPLCDNNFDLAWNALNARYENKRVLVDNQLKVLFNIPVASVESSESIQMIHSTVNDSLCTLKSLNVKVESWDPILIYLISTKLPDETLSLWEQSLKSHRDLPSWSQMDEFLINRFEVVERISSIKSTKEHHSRPAIKYSQPQNRLQTYVSQEKLNQSCKLCKSDHSIRICPEFRKFTPQERIDFVFKNKLCNNCLSGGHIKLKCKSKHSCITCGKQHHTLLHLQSNTSASKPEPQRLDNSVSTENQNRSITNSDQQPKNEFPSSSSRAQFSQIQANFSCNQETILLRTALVQIEHNGELFTVRALIDPGSQRTFLSERIRSRLQIPSRKSHFEIIGIGGKKQTANKECELTLSSQKCHIRFSIKAIVLPKVTKRLPAISFVVPKVTELKDLDLADPNFNKSSNIDLILGNDSERFINIEGIKKNVCGQASAYNTIFGWVLSGPMISETIHSFTTNVVPSDKDNLNDILRKFWELEEIPTSPPISVADKFCEDFYSKTTTRRPDGRYMVRLPFKQEFPQTLSLGSSRFIALGQYSRMEKMLSKDHELQQEYNSVLTEYIKLNHMEETSSREDVSDGKFNSFYLPHHAVVRPEHKSTKVRIVFNASRKTKSGFSLNDVLYKGPTLQTDLISTVLNWRKYKYVFSGDIQKMYRQILVDPADRAFQRILFQKDQNGPIKDYKLNTVTFGVNCAPFLAIRTLLQLALDSESQYPQVASILRKETYVDDILSGGFTIDETINSQTQLITVLKSAGFPLKKITANDPRLLAQLPPDDLYDLDLLRFNDSSSTKTLGIKWNALRDCFSYSFDPIQRQSTVTKRQVLSAVAQLFDPAGWITPVIIRAKMLMQQLWLEGLNWDEDVSPDSLHAWNNLLSDFTHIENIVIPRWIQCMPTDSIQIHGFSDASKGAYCASVYIRCQTSSSTVFCNLLIAKSKVAPLQTICLPRLELNGALLLAKLVKYVMSILDFNVSETILWTDASIVLGWLSKPPWSWETYVANRTSQIHEFTPGAKWRHVPTHDNPADLGTRGSKPQDLTGNSLWWNGPSWLTTPESNWPNRNPLVSSQVSLDSKQPVQTLFTITEEDDILLRFSSYSRALRVLSYVFRFFRNAHAIETRTTFVLLTSLFKKCNELKIV